MCPSPLPLLQNPLASTLVTPSRFQSTLLPQLAAVHSVRLLPVCYPALPLPPRVCEGGEALPWSSHRLGRQQAGRQLAGRQQLEDGHAVWEDDRSENVGEFHARKEKDKAVGGGSEREEEEEREMDEEEKEWNTQGEEEERGGDGEAEGVSADEGMGEQRAVRDEEGQKGCWRHLPEVSN
ncbi:unnamed protein product [Closterium sp. NIES-64]|nr:unnamed protein product [Closterium sp. NIES-64]